MDLYAGAYAAVTKQPAALVDDYYRLLALDPLVGGLEEPWTGQPLADRGWPMLVTTIPGTMDAIAANPAFGLASTDESGRRAALDDVAALRGEALRLADARGAQVVRGVELHTAPRATTAFSDAGALADSLEQIASWQWDGVDLLVEHCDAAIAGQSVAKGFLSLQDELVALRGLPVGLVVNWGRSAIELRDTDRVVDHLVAAREAGVLRGLVFSGAADADGDHVTAWADQHLPVFRTSGVAGEQLSLLTEERMGAALAAAGSLDYLGLKVGWRAGDAPATDRAALVSRGLAALAGLLQ